MQTRIWIGLLFTTALFLGWVVQKISVNAKQVELIEHLKNDWKYHIHFHLTNNKYRGLSHSCYQLLVVLYYIIKSIFIIFLLGLYTIYKSFAEYMSVEK